MKRPAISLIIPAYNEEKRIYRTLLSVTKAVRSFELETNEEMEIIVVDNNSIDRTVEIAEIFGVKIVQEKRHIISAVRNTGAKAAQGDILCFLDADSEVSENIFCLVYHAMQTGEYIGGGAKMKLDQNGLFYKGLSFGSLVMSYITGVSAVLIYTQRETFEKLGGFDEKYYAGEDLKFIFNLRKEGKRLGKQFKNIYNGYVVTSARKFNAMNLKDIALFASLLLNNSMMMNPEYCQTWYDLSKRGE